MRITVDTGGTFTDIIFENSNSQVSVFKVPTTQNNPSQGIVNGLNNVAKFNNLSIEKFLNNIDTFTHATTHAINAILTKKTAKTAFICTEGHPDTLLFREGGRIEIFNFTVEYPDPYIPRSLTFQIPERINYDGSISKNLDEVSLLKTILKMKKLNIESIGVCFLWSTVNPTHENRVAEILDIKLPGIPYSLSHKVNPTLREYRRASSTCIDASLKPIMTKYLLNLKTNLEKFGFKGQFLMVTSQGGVKDIELSSQSPVHLINSGPSMAPIGANFYLQKNNKYKQGIVTDLGGTTFDISLIKNNKVPRTRETWIGQKYRGHMTGFPSVDVRSIGAGGGSIAWVDGGGMLHVGPDSAGASPGPACYGNGGLEATVTDAALVCGIINPNYFLGGDIKLNTELAIKSIKQISSNLKLNIYETALSILDVVTENMAQEIKSLTIHQGIDPGQSVLIAGGGASGINAVNLGKRLGCKNILIPDLGPTLSAAGALVADLTSEFSLTLPMNTRNFDSKKANLTIHKLTSMCKEFINGPGANTLSYNIEYYIEAKYTDQVWEIEVPLSLDKFLKKNGVVYIEEEFHKTHKNLFEVDDISSDIEIMQWNARVSCKVSNTKLNINNKKPKPSLNKYKFRNVYFKSIGKLKTKVFKYEDLIINKLSNGPAIIETPFTSILIAPDVNYKINNYHCLEIILKSNNKKIQMNEKSALLW